MDERYAALVAEWRQRRLNRLECECDALSRAAQYAKRHGHPNAAEARQAFLTRYGRLLQQREYVRTNAP